MPTDRGRSPVLEYPPHRVKSPAINSSGPPEYLPPRPYDHYPHQNFHSKFFPLKTPQHSYSHHPSNISSSNSSLVQSIMDTTRIKSEAPSPPPPGAVLPQSLFRQQQQSPGHQRTFQVSKLLKSRIIFYII